MYLSIGPGFQNSKLLETIVAVDRWSLAVDRQTALSTDRPCLLTKTVPEPKIDFWMLVPVDNHLLVSTVLEGRTLGYVCEETNLDDILLLRL
ncbi:hypothetical protein Taro_031491 [Colocasia esculenta]|uniref:Uncharacterized protein n=1 Tax=Colocasia esculenta TaxID=4460 RepID=A0A843VWU2_COLES|nr:hypothetical protein [Colocasia esculenta]